MTMAIPAQVQVRYEDKGQVGIHVEKMGAGSG